MALQLRKFAPKTDVTNQSLAVWATRRAGANSSSLEAHFNFRRIAGNEEFRRHSIGDVRDFREIGVMLHDSRRVDSVCIYVPPSSGTGVRVGFHRVPVASNLNAGRTFFVVCIDLCSLAIQHGAVERGDNSHNHQAVHRRHLFVHPSVRARLL